MFEYVPSGHSEHVVRLEMVPYEPTGQFVQFVIP